MHAAQGQVHVVNLLGRYSTSLNVTHGEILIGHRGNFYKDVCDAHTCATIFKYEKLHKFLIRAPFLTFFISTRIYQHDLQLSFRLHLLVLTLFILHWLRLLKLV